jgi:hypothetical protein
VIENLRKNERKEIKIEYLVYFDVGILGIEEIESIEMDFGDWGKRK